MKLQKEDKTLSSRYHRQKLRYLLLLSLCVVISCEGEVSEPDQSVVEPDMAPLVVVDEEDQSPQAEDRVVPVEDMLSPVEDMVSPVEDMVSPVEDMVSPVEDMMGNMGGGAGATPGGGMPDPNAMQDLMKNPSFSKLMSNPEFLENTVNMLKSPAAKG